MIMSKIIMLLFKNRENLIERNDNIGLNAVNLSNLFESL